MGGADWHRPSLAWATGCTADSSDSNMGGPLRSAASGGAEGAQVAVMTNGLIRKSKFEA